MSLQDNYRETILEQIIRDLLASGLTPSIEDIKNAFNQYLIDHDLNKPQFEASTNQVQAQANSSASLFNKTRESIKKDLSVLYKSSLTVANDSMKSFDRWRAEMDRLESQLIKLDERVTGLLLTSKDTTGYFNFVSDKFADTSKIDIENSSCLVDLGRGFISLGTSNNNPSKIHLNNITSNDAQFSVLTSNNIQATVIAEGSEVVNAFHDQTKFWQSRVYSNAPQVVVAELKVKLAEDPLEISRISISLHSSNTSSSIQITPLYSVDGINYSQLPSDFISLSLTDKGTFLFTPVLAKYVKFILSKAGFDNIDGLLYVYEFGANDISFYKEGFNTDNATAQTLYSLPLSVKSADGSLATFNSVALNVCERVPTNTTIVYSVASSSEVVEVSGLNWASIDPLERSSPINPTVVNFNNLSQFEYGNSTSSGAWVKISYDAASGNPNLINPGRNFNLVTISGISSVSAVSATDTRYILPTSNDSILNYQFTTASAIEEDQVVVLRNLGIKGDTSRVRGVQTGWGYTEPYYSTTIEILDKSGVDINFGDRDIIIDEVVSRGTLHISTGLHLVKVHKSNWVSVGSLPLGVHTIDGLKSVDPLYPFNHKLLIEGYSYPNDFSGEQVYVGIDLFAELKLIKVSPFDLIHSTQLTDYSKFAIDLDSKDGAREPSKVIIVKTNSGNPDFINERFVVRAKVNQSALLLKYIWLRADLSTSDSNLAPILDSYRIKLSK